MDAVGDIDGDSFAWKKVADILVNEVSGSDVWKLSIECRPATGGRPGRRENSLQNQLFSERLGNFHLHGEEFNYGHVLGCRIIILATRLKF